MKKIPLVIGVLFLLGCNKLLLSPQTDAMAPTIEKGDKVVLDTFAYDKASDVSRWDIIAFELKGNDNTSAIWIKRVIALPGETVILSGSKIFINEEEVDIPNDLKALYTTFDEIPSIRHKNCEIPNDMFFLIGDNVNNSLDSRSLGPIKFKIILGKVVEINKKQ